MANYGRGYGNETPEDQEKYDDDIALQEGDYDWLEKSPRQNRLRQEQGLSGHEYAREVDE